MENIKKELDKIKNRIFDPDFLANKGLANEVGIHVFCYDPRNEFAVRSFVRELAEKKTDDYRVIVCDLYEIFLKILEEKKILGAVAALESKRGKEYVLSQIQKIASQEVFIDKIQYSPHLRGDVMFIVGVGKVYPFMRAHKILNVIQEPFSDVPIVMMYPGSYNGQKLDLFGEIFDENYYRAYNLINKERV